MDLKIILLGQINFGFRNKEECVSLFISIREICQRRKNDNKETYLAFLDLKKGNDSVPIGNILYKLDALGIRGKCYQFIKKSIFDFQSQC